jgi:hypothetical protein
MKQTLVKELIKRIGNGEQVKLLLRASTSQERREVILTEYRQGSFRGHFTDGSKKDEAVVIRDEVLASKGMDITVL